MYLPLTDRLICPRCGPPLGLILLAERVTDRRVISGTLGCPNCRDRFPIREGFVDLRAPPRRPLASGHPLREPDPELTIRVAALLGIMEGPATVLLSGPVLSLAGGLAGYVEGLEVVALGPALAGAAERAGVSRMVGGPGLPFQTSSLRGVVLEGAEEGGLVDEAARVLAPSARLVFLDAPQGLGERLSAVGLEPLLQEAGTLVAGRRAPREAPSGRTLPVV